MAGQNIRKEKVVEFNLKTIFHVSFKFSFSFSVCFDSAGVHIQIRNLDDNG